MLRCKRIPAIDQSSQVIFIRCLHDPLSSACGSTTSVQSLIRQNFDGLRVVGRALHVRPWTEYVDTSRSVQIVLDHTALVFVHHVYSSRTPLTLLVN